MRNDLRIDYALIAVGVGAALSDNVMILLAVACRAKPFDQQLEAKLGFIELIIARKFLVIFR